MLAKQSNQLLKMSQTIPSQSNLLNQPLIRTMLKAQSKTIKSLPTKQSLTIQPQVEHKKRPLRG